MGEMEIYGLSILLLVLYLLILNWSLEELRKWWKGEK
jgi:hypothetical protein